MVKNRLWLVAAAMVCVACGSGSGKGQAAAAENNSTECRSDGHDASNSLDYQGVYKGTLPAADCPGIDVTLELKADGTFSSVYDYLERDASFENKGTYVLDKNLLIVVGEKNDTTYYKVEENRLRQLDGDRQVIEGEIGEHFVLTKQLAN